MARNDFYSRVATASLMNGPAVLSRVLPGGRIEGREYVVRNPTRNDGRPGSFKVNLQSGRWADFACGDKGGDLISLVAYLFSIRQSEAAARLADMLGVHHDV